MPKNTPIKTFLSYGSPCTKIGKASSSARQRLREQKEMKASMTVEAAMAVPLFFLAVISLLYLLEFMAVQTAVRSGMQAAAAQVMQENLMLQILSPDDVKDKIVKHIGEDRLDRSVILNGSSGLDCGKSYLSPLSGIGKITVTYKLRLPISAFFIAPITREESMRIKMWTGYKKELVGDMKEDTVYVTENGIAYHKSLQCTHLKLSIRMTSKADLGKLRNEGGGKYYPCEKCGKKKGGTYFVTDSGDRYHTSVSCSGLKRTIYAIPVSEAVGKGACSRCCR